jgi:hypothetical protein
MEFERPQRPDDPVWSAPELHRATIAHAAARVDVARQLSGLGREFIRLSNERFARAQRRIRQSMERIERLPGGAAWTGAAGGTGVMSS